MQFTLVVPRNINLKKKNFFKVTNYSSEVFEREMMLIEKRFIY